MTGLNWSTTLVVSISVINMVSTFKVDFEKCYEQKELINGCSVPWGFDIPYKGLFTLACDYHDVCYSCASGMSYSRAECDEAFLKNMQHLCFNNNNTNTNNAYSTRMERASVKTSAWERFMAALKGSAAIGMEFWYWAQETTSLEHCLRGANVYFHAVKHFSMDYYHHTPDQGCHLPCAKIMGNPLLSLNTTFV